MRKFCFLFFGLISVYSSLLAQVSVAGFPESFSLRTKQGVVIPTKLLKSIDTAFYTNEDRRLGILNRYSVVQELEVDIRKSGIRTEIPGKGYIWRYRVSSPDAYSLGLLFSRYYLPDRSRLFIYSDDQASLLGAFTNLNNNDMRLLAIAELKSKSAVLEYFEPYNSEFEGELVLGSVSKAYRDITAMLASVRIGINCPEGSEWQDEKRSVCRMTYQEGKYGYYCTGFLVNNTSQDGTPYFMTANHCISNNTVASTLVTYFNYENSTCTSTDAGTTQTISGATLKATGTVSDFTLLVLKELPPVSYNAYLAGWDASTTTPLLGVGIHHPSGAPKCISIDIEKPTNFPGKIIWDSGVTTPENSHWSVKFDYGDTESGSSGSPLFDENSRVIGQLHGGDETESFYGKFSVSWDKSASVSEQLKAWLDPVNTGTKILEGSYLKAKPKTAFTASYTNTCLNEEITLTDQSLNFPTGWVWKISPLDYSFVNGTGSSSRNPQVVFKKGGRYTVTLITTNFYGKDSLVSYNFITVAESIQVSFSGILPDTAYCGFNLGSKPFVVKGAHNYTFEVDNTDKLNLTARKDTLLLNVAASAKKYGSFNTKVKVRGTMGTCADTDSLNLKIIMPPNDYIANAIHLWPGNNTGYSNICGCPENKEPMPPLVSCVSKDSWCPDLSKSINNSVWFTFTGPSNGRVTIDTYPIDTRIAVYEASSYKDIVSGNPAIYSMKAANDNRAGNNLSAGIEDLEVTPGKTYWLQVDTKAGKAGNFSIQMLSNSLEVFPNPSNGKFELIISSFEGGPAEVTIFSGLGKKIFSGRLDVSLSKNRFEVDLSTYPTGMYFIRVKNSASTLTSKVMVVSN